MRWVLVARVQTKHGRHAKILDGRQSGAPRSPTASIQLQSQTCLWIEDSSCQLLVGQVGSRGGGGRAPSTELEPARVERRLGNESAGVGDVNRRWHVHVRENLLLGCGCFIARPVDDATDALSRHGRALILEYGRDATFVAEPCGGAAAAAAAAARCQ